MFCLDARSRSRDADGERATPVVVLRDRIMGPRSPSRLYNHAAAAGASAAMVRKLISRSAASIGCKEADTRRRTLFQNAISGLLFQDCYFRTKDQ
jgi:hypothetical protein